MDSAVTRASLSPVSRNRKGLGICLLVCFGLTSCADLPTARLSPPDRLSQLMPDGMRWTLANLSVEIPGSYCYDDDPSKCARYGRLYSWTAAQEACGSLGRSEERREGKGR